jgi:hypothetical protein
MPKEEHALLIAKGLKDAPKHKMATRTMSYVMLPPSTICLVHLVLCAPDQWRLELEPGGVLYVCEIIILTVLARFNAPTAIGSL